MLALTVETGKHKGKRLRLPDGENIVGRDEQAQIRIASEEVSRKHCVLTVQGTHLRVRDLGSRNGTFVNGRPITEEVELQPGDHLVIGPMGFQLHAAAAEPAEGKPAPARKPGKSPSQKLSDDEIAAWLGLGGDEASSTSDTAIINAGVAEEPAPQIVAPPKKVFRSTAEEAADIIRRHREAHKE